MNNYFIACKNCCRSSKRKDACNGCVIEELLKLKKGTHGLMFFIQMKAMLIGVRKSPQM